MDRLRTLSAWWCVSLVAATVDVCLDDAVPAEQRVNVKVPVPGKDDIVELPLGVYALNWKSAQIAADILKIIVREVIGVNVVESSGDSSKYSLYAIAGCRDPEQVERDCSAAVLAQPSRWHLVLELWSSYVTHDWIRIQEEFPRVLPMQLGSVGYSGSEGIFVGEAQRTLVYRKSAAPIDFYRAWNASRWDHSEFFSNYSDINMSSLKKCDDTPAFTHDNIETILRVTGDVSTFDVRDPMAYKLACHAEKWWFAPACVKTPDRCVPVLTGGSGWFATAILQRSIEFHMPLALATSEQWSKPGHVVLLYSWMPDDTHIDKQLKEVSFELHDKGLWQLGDQTTAAKSIDLLKVVHKDLHRISGTVYQVALAYSVSYQVIVALMTEAHQRNESTWQVSCRWLRENQRNWREWVPNKFKCYPGQGLMDGENGFVETIAAAQGCDVCAAGTFSQEVLGGDIGDEALGRSHVCRACVEGRFQARPGKTLCQPCPDGMFTIVGKATLCHHCSDDGSNMHPDNGTCVCDRGHIKKNDSDRERCTSCKRGYYAAPEDTSCTRCPWPLDTREGASTSIEDCTNVITWVLVGLYSAGAVAVVCTCLVLRRLVLRPYLARRLHRRKCLQIQEQLADPQGFGDFEHLNLDAFVAPGLHRIVAVRQKQFGLSAMHQQVNEQQGLSLRHSVQSGFSEPSVVPAGMTLQEALLVHDDRLRRAGSWDVGRAAEPLPSHLRV